MTENSPWNGTFTITDPHTPTAPPLNLISHTCTIINYGGMSRDVAELMARCMHGGDRGGEAKCMHGINASKARTGSQQPNIPCAQKLCGPRLHCRTLFCSFVCILSHFRAGLTDLLVVETKVVVDFEYYRPPGVLPSESPNLSRYLPLFPTFLSCPLSSTLPRNRILYVSSSLAIDSSAHHQSLPPQICLQIPSIPNLSV